MRNIRLITKKFGEYIGLWIILMSTNIIIVSQNNLRSDLGIFVKSIVSLLGIPLVILFYANNKEPEIINKKPPTRNIKKNDNIGFRSDVGRIRKIDEDSILIQKTTIGRNHGEDRTLLIVADGMGGHQKGEIASLLATKAIQHEYNQIDKMKKPIDYNKFFAEAFQKANSRIVDFSKRSPDSEGMGTTLTACIIEGNLISIGHVGDTSAYLINKNQIIKITKDHSLVQELIDKGEITPQQARNHPQKNVITRVVGYYANVLADVYNFQKISGSQILICCDGLTNYIEVNEILKIVLESSSTQKACETLVDTSNQRGGSDNISVILTPKM